MFLKKINSIRHTLAFRLTFWYAGIFMLTSCVAFFFFYFLITSVIRDRTDQDLLGEARTLSSILKVQGMKAVKRRIIFEAQAAGEKKVFFFLLAARRFLLPICHTGAISGLARRRSRN